MSGEDVEQGHDDLEYCRSVETYLCRKNDGHLIRIVGPSFELVTAWAEQGVPLKVAYRGIDRYFERYYSKSSRRRPVRVEFCSADVLDVFDEWRRAIGVADIAAAGEGGVDDPSSASDSHAHRKSLPAHLDRAVLRLTAVQARVNGPLGDVVTSLIERLESFRATARGIRGAAREALLEQLAAFDRELLQSARSVIDAAAAAELTAEAETELAPFRSRMPAEAFERARAACVDRLVRERSGLPILSLE